MQTDLSCEQILDAFSSGVILTDAHGEIVWVNPQALKLLGSRQRNMVGKKLQDAVPAMGILATQCLKSGESLLNQHVFIQNTNYICHITPIPGETRMRGCVCALEVISGYKLSANQLESYNFIKKQLDSIFHFAPYGFWICDGQGRVTRISKAAEKLIGIDSSNKKELSTVRSSLVILLPFHRL